MIKFVISLPPSCFSKYTAFKSIRCLFASSIIFFSINLHPDSFRFNNFNNHGSVGLINMPSARFYPESSYGITIYDGTPDQKITMTSAPFEWLEASFFYTNIQDKPYPGYEYQDYKDKGFNIKARILKETKYLPAVAIGINDIAGTGLYSSEFIVASYGLENLDFHLGLGWGTLNGLNDIDNPLSIIDERFNNRPIEFEDEGGQFQVSRYFSGEDLSVFYGLSYFVNEKTNLKIERDTTKTPGEIGYENSSSNISFGIDYNLNENFLIGISFERENFVSLKFSYKQDTKTSSPKHRYKRVDRKKTENNYGHFIRTLNKNDIGVEKISRKDNILGIEITQFTHPSLEIIEEIIMSARMDANISEDIKTNYKVAGLTAIEEFDDSFLSNSENVFTRGRARGLNSSTRLNLRPFIAGREGFLKASLLVENDLEYIFKDNLFFSSNLKYSIWDNFDDLIIPPKDTYPEQVRSDVKDYLRNFNRGVVLGRAQLDYHLTLSEKNHLMLTAGVLEEMFSGYGLEFLHFDSKKNYAYGFEIFDAYKRDYKLNFDLLNYKVTTGHLNFYYRNYDYIPFDAKVSYGKYLAGDIGGTLELSRTFQNGVKFGIFATFTDVSSEDFGEGSFDKGIFFNIPIFSNYINYTWRPLTKDPGAKLVRKNTLHDMLIRFKPIN